MENKQYTILLEAVRKLGKRMDDLEKVTNDIKKDMGDDRVKIDDVILAQNRLHDTLEIMRGDTNNLSKKTESVVKNAMTSVMQPAVDSVDSLKKTIDKKKTIIIFKNGFLDWFKNKMTGGNK